jgi:transposase
MDYGSKSVVEYGVRFVGLDVAKDRIAVAVADGDGSLPHTLGAIANTPEAVEKLVRGLGPAAALSCWYEAGPTGYGLYRRLLGLGAQCTVVAPSLIPRRPGDRVKTDRRDALQLARLARSGGGMLTAVQVPWEEDEALRCLTRSREVSQEEVVQRKNRLRKVLDLWELQPPASPSPWTKRWWEWLRGLKVSQAPLQIVLAEYISAVEEAQQRVQRLEVAIAEALRESRLRPVAEALQALFGVQLVTASTLAAELGDLRRFKSARALMAYCGMVPREHSTGGRQRRGSLTKSGNRFVRRVIGQAAWQYLRPVKVGKVLQKRRQGQPAAIVAIAERAHERLHRRFWRCLTRGMLKQKAVIAVGRELLGSIWAIGQIATPAERVTVG